MAEPCHRPGLNPGLSHGCQYPQHYLSSPLQSGLFVAIDFCGEVLVKRLYTSSNGSGIQLRTSKAEPYVPSCPATNSNKMEERRASISCLHPPPSPKFLDSLLGVKLTIATKPTCLGYKMQTLDSDGSLI